MATAAVPSAGRPRRLLHRPRRRDLAGALVVTWSRPAALRAVRAAVVVPGLFALTTQVVGDGQMATFAAFGGFATLVLAGFGGTRRDKLLAHAVLAATGAVLLVIGTAVTSSVPVAVVVTIPVAFLVLFSGVASANAASGATAALLAYVLPAASPGSLSMVGSREAGWWLASAAGTLAVLSLSPPPPGDALRRAVSEHAIALAAQLRAGLATDEAASAAATEAAVEAKHRLFGAATASPSRPTGLGLPDRAIADLVEAMQWCAAAVAQAVASGSCQRAGGPDRERLEEAAGVLEALGAAVQRVAGADVDLEDRLGRLEADLGGPPPDTAEPAAVHRAFHSRLVAAAARTAALDTLLALRRIGPAEAADAVSRWWGRPVGPDGVPAAHPAARVARQLLQGHTSMRSIWVRNSARGAAALAAAVAIAGATNVQHGFWVVLGALSVLRTSAASTGATAARALLGTVLGVAVGAPLILAIGHSTTALWVALPLATVVAGYAPGTAPFALGQAAFTVTISVLYNLIVPVGWRVGEVRIEDVALGVAVSAAVGVLFWPRGATRVVADDLADAFHTGAVYLVQAAGWALGLRDGGPDGAPAALAAGLRLDDALRGLLAEQGTHRVPREVLWRLVGGALRLRLMAAALERTPPPAGPPGHDAALAAVAEVVRLAGRYDALAAELGRVPPTVAQELAALHLDGAAPDTTDPRVAWVDQHVEHLALHLDDLEAPAGVVAERLAAPWWR